MTRMAHNNDVFLEITRLHKADFHLLPLVGKVPLINFRNVHHPFPLKTITDKMNKVASFTYGVRLKGLLVIDIDDDDLALVANMEERFGEAKVIVKTPRGYHLYYKFNGNDVPNLKAEGLPIDIKHGQNSYVVGPCSIRSDGDIYVYTKDCLSKTKLVNIKLPHSVRPTKAPNSKIQVGQRHHYLKRQAPKQAGRCGNLRELIKQLFLLRDADCDDPASVSDQEVQELAKWVWNIKKMDQLHKGNNSTFKINRKVFDSIGNNSDARSIYMLLVNKHGHKIDKDFPLDHKTMRESDLTDLSRERFQKAVKHLTSCGTIKIAKQYRAGKYLRTYCLRNTVF